MQETDTELTCDCCGHTETFSSPDEAYSEGWDCAPFFTGYTSCGFCPGSWTFLGETYKHADVHEKWRKQGRPL